MYANHDHRDQRNPSAPSISYVESHTDTITSLQLHPSHPSLLLSSSTDGLVNIFDTSQADEDDALFQVINHRSAIAHAGFMFPGTDIYALGTDETMSLYALQSQKEEEEEPAPRAFGDVREGLGCEYLVDMHWVGSQPFIAAGKHRHVGFRRCVRVEVALLTRTSLNRLEVVPITKSSAGPLQYEYDLARSIKLHPAHGEEIVRDMFTDVHVSRYSTRCFVS
jgi:WD40 repeat protein